MRRHFLVQLLLIGAPGMLPAQTGLPGTNINATVHVTNVTMVGDTTTITTSVAVNRGSLEHLGGFAIVSSAPIKAIESPGSGWQLFRNYAGVPGPSWWPYLQPIAPGDSTRV